MSLVQSLIDFVQYELPSLSLRVLIVLAAFVVTGLVAFPILDFWMNQ